MSINARTTFFFTDGKYGWSETFFSQPEGLAEAKAKALVLARSRFALLGQGPVFSGIRVSDDDVQRDSLIVLANEIPVDKVRPSDASDVPYSSLLLRWNSGSLYWRQHYCRGVPDVDITDPEDLGSKASLIKGFGLFKKAILEGQYRLKVTLRGAENPPIVITAIAADAFGWDITAPGHGLIDDAQVRISGATGDNMPRGVYRVKVIDGNNFTALKTPPAGPVFYTGGGKVHKILRAYKLITDGQIVRQTHRDTGRPFDSPRGRRRRRAV